MHFGKRKSKNSGRMAGKKQKSMNIVIIILLNVQPMQ